MAHDLPPVRLIEGGIRRDARGEVRFVNRFDFSKVDRLYSIQPKVVGAVRGWVGHRRDWKWFGVLRGEMKVGVVVPEVWDAPSGREPVTEYLLNDTSPGLLEIPPGRCTASAALSEGSVLLVLSSGFIEDAVTDDFRFPADRWKLA